MGYYDLMNGQPEILNAVIRDEVLKRFKSLDRYGFTELGMMLYDDEPFKEGIAYASNDTAKLRVIVKPNRVDIYIFECKDIEGFYSSIKIYAVDDKVKVVEGTGIAYEDVDLGVMEIPYLSTVDDKSAGTIDTNTPSIISINAGMDVNTVLTQYGFKMLSNDGDNEDYLYAKNVKLSNDKVISVIYSIINGVELRSIKVNLCDRVLATWSSTNKTLMSIVPDMPYIGMSVCGEFRNPNGDKCKISSFGVDLTSKEVNIVNLLTKNTTMYNYPEHMAKVTFDRLAKDNNVSLSYIDKSGNGVSYQHKLAHVSPFVCDIDMDGMMSTYLINEDRSDRISYELDGDVVKTLITSGTHIFREEDGSYSLLDNGNMRKNIPVTQKVIKSICKDPSIEQWYDYHDKGIMLPLADNTGYIEFRYHAGYWGNRIVDGVDSYKSTFIDELTKLSNNEMVKDKKPHYIKLIKSVIEIIKKPEVTIGKYFSKVENSGNVLITYLSDDVKIKGTAHYENDKLVSVFLDAIIPFGMLRADLIEVSFDEKIKVEIVTSDNPSDVPYTDAGMKVMCGSLTLSELRLNDEHEPGISQNKEYDTLFKFMNATPTKHGNIVAFDTLVTTDGLLIPNGVIVVNKSMLGVVHSLAEQYTDNMVLHAKYVKSKISFDFENETTLDIKLDDTELKINIDSDNAHEDISIDMIELNGVGVTNVHTELTFGDSLGDVNTIKFRTRNHNYSGHKGTCKYMKGLLKYKNFNTDSRNINTRHI